MNNKKNNWNAQLLFALRSVILLKIIFLASPIWAQGRLSGVRQEVRRPSRVEADKPAARKRPSSSERKHRDQVADNDNRDRKEAHRPPARQPQPRARRARPSRNQPRVAFFVAPTPRPVIHTREIHVIEPAPVYSPVVQTVVPQQAQVETYPSVVQSEPILIEEPVYDEVFVSEFQQWSGRVTGWYGGGIDDISQGNLGALFQVPNGIGLDTNVRTIRERGFSDHLWLGDLNLVYEPVCTDYFRMRIGAGFNWLADSWGTDFGFNLTTGFDAKLSERWILGGEVDLGNLGHSDYLHAQLNLGYRIQNVELVVGYDHTNIGNVNLDSPFAGLRFRY